MNLRKKLSYIVESSTNNLKKLIANELLINLDEKKFLSINEIAEKCWTTKSTITKFAQKLGYEGYKELILRLKFERANYAVYDDRETKFESYYEVKEFFIEIIDYFDI